ncbi:MAG: VacJ family lipoprotein [Rickettsiaceae bacterium]|nr:MAG: VacJ family lipoprotein [Rickettsiaceae bacterium]
MIKSTKVSAIIALIIFCSVNSLAVDIENESENEGYKYTYNIEEEDAEAYDPYEKLNRKIFAFNAALDRFTLRPIAVFYKNVTNDYTRDRVRSFADNINTPLTFVNQVLQTKFNQALKTFWRFTINTTLGVGGLFDIASKFGLNYDRQTFGNTLAYYGVGPGPYLVLPFFGSTNARDVTDSTITNDALNPIKYKLHKDFKSALTATKIIHDRATILPFSDHIEKDSTDPYVAVRSAVHQNRESKVEYPKGFKYPETSNP